MRNLISQPLFKMSEVKNIPRLRFRDFKDNWTSKMLKELVPKGLKNSIVDGPFGSNLKREHYRDEGVPIITSGYVTKGYFYADKYLYVTEEKFIKEKRSSVKGGDIVMAKIGARCGSSAILPQQHVESILSGNALKITINNELNSTNFIWQYLYFLYTTSKLEPLKTVGAQPAISMSNLKKFELYVPSLPEQQKIADFLTAVDKRVELLENKKTLLETYKKGVMKKIFNQEIRFKDENGNDFPDWEEKRLDEISKFRRGSFPQPYGLPEWYDDINGKPFVQVFDVGENFKLKPQTKQKISSLAEPKSVFVPKESVVITIQGSIGRVAITQYDSYVDRTLLIFKELNGCLDKYFFVYQLYRLFEIEKRRAPGGTIKTITKEKLSSFTIQIPEKNEQLKISNFLFSIDKQLELLDTHIDKSKTWKKGLLQKMFV